MTPLRKKLLTAWTVLKRHGFAVFWEETIERLSLRPRYLGESIGFPGDVLSSANVVSVSVVVPTRNGGADLQNLLRSLLKQKGCQLQIILIDSGSSDGSLAIPEAKNVEIIAIAPQDFSHSGSRNLGVEHCRHDLVFLTVQDAFLPHDRWISTLSSAMEQNGLSALSVAEIPRPDAEYHARYSVDSHNRSIEDRSGQTRIYRGFRGTRSDRIRAASIGNVACLYRRRDLELFPFEGSFGEDFTVAIRLLKHGLSVGRTNCLQVIHSHNRTAGYWMKRMCLSRQLLRQHGLSEKTYSKKKTDFTSSVMTLLQLLEVVSSTDEPTKALELWLSDPPIPAQPLGEAIRVLGQIDQDILGFLDRFGFLELGGSKCLDNEIVDEVRGFHRFVLANDSFRSADNLRFQTGVLCVMASKLGWQLGGISDDFDWEAGEQQDFFEYMANGV